MDQVINLSVIVPVFNDGEGLKRLLKSIPADDDIEVIVIDDNSTESIEFIAEALEYGENHLPNFAAFKNDRGVQSAGTCRNVGLDNAYGKWLMFADSDDYFVDGCFDAIRSHFNDAEDLIYYKATSIDELTKKEAQRHYLYNRTLSEYMQNPTSLYREMQLRYKCNGPVSKMVRREMVESNGIRFDQVIASNDEMFSTKCGFFAKKIAVYDDIIYCITSRPGSLITNVSEEKFWVRLEVFIRKYQFLRENLSRKEFINVDISSQEKIISLKKNGYSKEYCNKVMRELKKNGVCFLTLKTFDIAVFATKVRLFFDLKRIHKVEGKYEVKNET